jgi:hypothetical protein
MQWFIAKLAFRIIHRYLDIAEQFELQLRLIQATDMHEAAGLARNTGLDAEINSAVTWEFVGLTELVPVALSDGSLLLTETLEPEGHKDVLRHIRTRDKLVQECFVHPETPACA